MMTRIKIFVVALALALMGLAVPAAHAGQLHYLYLNCGDLAALPGYTYAFISIQLMTEGSGIFYGQNYNCDSRTDGVNGIQVNPTWIPTGAGKVRYATVTAKTTNVTNGVITHNVEQVTSVKGFFDATFHADPDNEIGTVQLLYKYKP